MSQIQPQEQNTMLDEAIGRDRNNASDPVGTVMGFFKAGFMFGAATTILGGIEAVGGPVGAMPGGTGIEPANINAAPRPVAPSVNPEMGMGM
jgi:hypothetical protein